ncbi:MAG: LCP family protein [Gordonia sp. (in: high G+C Gram-positive bacteria)]
MSRWTPKPRGEKPGDGDDDSATPPPAGGGSLRGTRRPRRAGRDSAPTDFTSMFGAPPVNEVPAHGSLREPSSPDRYIRGRSRMTVRELMEQMNAGTDVTQKIPAIGSEPNVDLSDRTTAERVRQESRAQENPTAATDADESITDGPPADELPADELPAADSSTANPPDNQPSGTEPSVPTTSVAPPLEPTPDLSHRLAARTQPQRVGVSADTRSLRRNITVTGRALVAIACITALVGTGFVWGYLKSVNGNWRTIHAVNPEDHNIRNKDAQYGDENYLIVGTDTRSGKNSTVGAGTTADAGGARSDTIILVNIPASRSRVVAVSFPRDLAVDRPECEEWDNSSGTYSGNLPAAQGVKLNSVYADGGPKCLVKVITEMSGLNINHFIGMDFYGFEKVVRAVGGVEVCSTTPLYDYELGQILRKPGKQKLNGRRALNYVRARTISTEGNGDYGRIKRQQLFMSSLLRSTLSGNVLSNPVKLNRIVHTFIQYSYVDGVDTASLLQLADSMQGIEAGRVTFLTIPTSGTTTDGANNEIPRTDDINTIFNAIINDDPLPGEAAKKTRATRSGKKSTSTQSSEMADTSPTTVHTVTATAQDPGNVGVRVLNGTGRTGVATEVSDQLTAQGFDVRGVADASQNQDNTTVRYGPGEKNSAATLATMIPGASIQSDRAVRSGVEIILGNSFTGTVESAPTSGTRLSAEQLPAAVNLGNLPNDLAVTNAGDTTCT